MNHSKSKVRVATMGTGYFSQYQYNAWKRISEVELVGVYNRTISKADEFGKRYQIPLSSDDLPAMLKVLHPDLLDIITPPETHLEAIRGAARLGISAICQKPFCRNLEEATEAVRIAETAGIQLIVHENFRFQPWYRVIKMLLDAQRLGQIYGIKFSLRPGDGQGPSAYLDRQPYFQKMPRFLIHETAIHFIDVFRYLLGEVSAVCASLRKLNPAIAGEDAGLVVFDFVSGASGLFDGNRLSDHNAKNRRLTMGEMQIEGSKGSMFLNGDGSLFIRRHSSNDVENFAYAWCDRDFGGNCVFNLQKHVVDHLLFGKPLENTAAEYLTNISIEESIYASSSEGRRISV
jgi:predicted dehydrogenase